MINDWMYLVYLMGTFVIVFIVFTFKAYRHGLFTKPALKADKELDETQKAEEKERRTLSMLWLATALIAIVFGAVKFAQYCGILSYGTAGFCTFVLLLCLFGVMYVLFCK